MIRYMCKNCGVSCETSICKICGERTEKESLISWCDICQVPIYEEKCPLCGEKGRVLARDLRPVFPEERLLLEIVIGKPFCFEKKSVWNGTGNIYYVNGKRLPFSIASLRERDTDEIRKKLDQLLSFNSSRNFSPMIERFLKANKKRFDEIEKEAIWYIRDRASDYQLTDLLVSFSGGKDSTVTSDLVMRALNTPDIAHIFGDTTLEFPETLQYIKRFRADHPQTPILTAMNKEKNFMELCSKIGPPSRIMRWCCTVFKTGAITRKIQSIFREKAHIVTFYGIRRNESSSRKKYARESESPKITKQTVISPIIDWYDFDVWLYILTRKMDFNAAYRLGYARVGCFCCPNNSIWSEFLTKIYMPEQYARFHQVLLEFAETIGKPDPKEYISGGFWKARQGGNGVEYAKRTLLSFEPCAVEENTFHYELKRAISEDLYEFFKPFGYLDHTLGNKRLGEVFVLDPVKKALLKIQGRVGSMELKVTIYHTDLGRARNLKAAEEKVKCQLTKYQMCMGCMACTSVCRHNAISIQNGATNYMEYRIEDKKCIRCGECVSHYIGGCYMRKVLKLKERKD